MLMYTIFILATRRAIPSLVGFSFDLYRSRDGMRAFQIPCVSVLNLTHIKNPNNAFARIDVSPELRTLFNNKLS